MKGWTLAVLAAVALTAAPARAQDGATAGSGGTNRPSVVPAEAPPEHFLPKPVPEAPPPPPRHNGLVVESGVGGLQFLGQFKHVAPLAPWAYTQVGYEPFRWLMAYGYGELSFTSTSESEDESHARAFAIFGFGGGVRVTIHVTDRVALFLQGSLGALEADVPHNALAVLGFRNAESLAVTMGGRLGVEWYQVDRHMALGLGVGLRDVTGFQRTAGASDTPLALDATGALRYTF